MKINKKLYSVALVSATLILFLILVSFTASAATPKITETRITTHGTASYPIIYGNTIVWADNRTGNDDIYAYDLSTHKETHIITNGSVGCPSIYGNIIVWLEDKNGNYSDLKLYMYDLSTLKKTQITNIEAAGCPVIYGNKIVWCGDHLRNGDANYDVYVYDLSTHKETRITNDGTGFDPVIYKNTIVWVESHDSGWGNICMYNISTHKKTQISSTSYGEYYDPVIYGNTVIWNDISGHVYMYNISTSKKTQIDTVNSFGDNDIYGSNVVFSSDYAIYMYNISTRQKTKITTSGTARRPDIYGDRIVWLDWRNLGDIDKTDVYMATLIYPPVAAFSASPISGKKPLTVKFTDKSTGLPASWFWNFGDKSTSTAKNPAHKYTKAGKYTVSLTVKNAASSNTVKKTSYITIK